MSKPKLIFWLLAGLILVGAVGVTFWFTKLNPEMFQLAPPCRLRSAF